MSREQERIRRKLEDNPIVECNKIQNKFYPELFSMFGRVIHVIRVTWIIL